MEKDDLKKMIIKELEKRRPQSTLCVGCSK